MYSFAPIVSCPGEKPRSVSARATVLLCLILAGGLSCNLATAAAVPREFMLPPAGNSLIGAVDVVQIGPDDTLADVTAYHRVGYNLMRSANPAVDAWLPEEKSQVIIPGQALLPHADYDGLVINVAEMRLYHFYRQVDSGQPSVGVYPISVGRRNWQTPMTETYVTGRVKDPTWYPPASIRKEHAEKGSPLPSQVPPGPDNPLGEYLLMLNIPSYFIHGTNKKFGIGMQVTHGCIRMYAEDIEHLVKNVPTRTPVKIINQRYKVGWSDAALYVEVHPALEGDPQKLRLSNIIRDIVAATVNRPDTEINWDRVELVAKQALGLPVKVGQIAAAE